MIYAEDEAQCKKLVHVANEHNLRPPIVLLSSKKLDLDGLEITPFDEFSAAPSGTSVDQEMQESVRNLKPDAMATIVYTSGTTGSPKGVVLTHNNLVSEVRGLISYVHIDNNDTTLTFLPFAHIMGRVESMIGIFAGWTLGFAESVNSVAQNITELKPTILVSVPRIYEKIFSKIQSEVANSPTLQKGIFAWAVSVGKSYVKLKAELQPIPVSLEIKYRVADSLVFKKVRNKLGGNIRLTVSGGAPLSRDLCEFFHACGIQILEGYGLTETTAAVAVNPRAASALVPSGSRCLNRRSGSRQMAKSWFVAPSSSRNTSITRPRRKESLNSEGWFSTGDIGEIDDRGYLKITDRKKSSL